MVAFTLTHPTATLSRGIENLVMFAEERSNPIIKVGCGITARVVSAVVFPVFLAFELVFKRVPKMLCAIGGEKFQRKADKVLKYSLALLLSPFLGLYAPEGVPGLFLKRQKTSREIRPFGVEKVFGKTVENGIDCPKSVSDVQQTVRKAKEKGEQISIIGAGMSQGTQTVPSKPYQRVIHMKHLNSVAVDGENNAVTVGAGATWEEVQLALDKEGKSTIVKQASDPFSIGGSIGINCHGWAHKYGAIANTVRSLKIVDAEGILRTLPRPRPGVAIEDLTDDEQLFKCMFGTLGYFGVVVEATFDIVDNEELVESTEEVSLDQYTSSYAKIADADVPLFGGRLVLDGLHDDPLREVFMVSYRRPDQGSRSLAGRAIQEEPKWGKRLERIALKLVAHLPHFAAKRLISNFWDKEKAAMLSDRIVTRNQALHPPINAFKILHHSDLHAQWLQEYFVKGDKLPNFLRFLGAELKAHNVRMINATIRPTPRDEISILPYAEKDRHAVVICFAQKKTEAAMEETQKWMQRVNEFLVNDGGVFYQAYMPFATREQFETCYGPERVAEMRKLKGKFDPAHRFGNAHTAKYYDQKETS
jgi:FAD/FMN-containing dehydrogenase